MERLNVERINSIRSLIENEKSLNTISNELSLSKSTCYYWYRKFKTSKVRKIKVNTSSKERIGEFIGIFAGDGNYTIDKRYHHQIRVFLTSKDVKYIEYVARLFKFICSKKPSIHKRSSYNVTVIRIISRDLLNFILNYLIWRKHKTKTVCLKNSIKCYSKQFLVGFLRGLVDTDGYINKNRIVFTTISKNLAKNIENSLKRLNIRYQNYVNIDKRKNRKQVSRILISRDFEKFIKIVKPKHL